MWENFKSHFGTALLMSYDVANREEVQRRILKTSKGSQVTYWGYILAVLLVAMGLNSNNLILIIGGMMIMPVFSSMIALGYAFVEGNTVLVGSSLMNFVVQVILGVFVSTAYFLVVGASEGASQLLYTTSPSFSLAFIGFAAGMITAIGITRQENVNLLSGAAVATAFLPSICTMGCGIAKGAMVFVTGGLYILFINSYFVCAGAAIVFFIVGRKIGISRGNRGIIHRMYLIIFAFVALAPVGLLVYQTLTHGITDQNIQRYVEEEYKFNGTRVVRTNVDKENNTIEILLLGNRVSDKNIERARKARSRYFLDDMDVKIFQSRTNPEALVPDNLKKDKIREYGETLKVMYPEIVTCEIGYLTDYTDDSQSIMVYLTTSEGLSQNTITEIKDYLAIKTEVKPVRLLYDIQTDSAGDTSSDSSDYGDSTSSSTSSYGSSAAQGDYSASTTAQSTGY